MPDDGPRLHPLEAVGLTLAGREQRIEGEAALVHAIAVAVEAVFLEKLASTGIRR